MILLNENGHRVVLLERMTFDQLYRYADPGRVFRSGHVSGPPLDIEAYEDTIYYAFNFKSNPSTTGLRHRGYIKFFKPRNGQKPLQHVPCLVDCTCPDYRYRWAWANKQRQSGVVGNNSLNQALNRAPRITNPRSKPGLCIAAGSYVRTKRGYIPIELVVPGDFVETLEGPRAVTAAVRTGRKKILRVETQSGRSLRLTGEHRVYTFNEETGFTWKEAAKLALGDSLIKLNPSDNSVPLRRLSLHGTVAKAHNALNYSVKSVALDARMAELVGYMVAEGSPGFFASQNSELTAHFFENWKAVFGEKSATLRKNGVFIGRQGTLILEKMGLCFGSYGKNVPEWIMQGSNDVIAAFLRGCYAGDGNFRKRHSTYGTVSERLARQMLLLLDAVGVNAALDRYPSGVNRSLIWVLRTSSREQSDKLYDILRPLRGRSAAGSGGSHSRSEHVIFNARRYFAKQLDEYLPRCSDDSVELLQNLCAEAGVGSVDSVAAQLASAGVLLKMHIKRGGKPHNAVKRSDFYLAVRPRLIAKILAKVQMPKTTGWRIARHRLKLVLDALRDVCSVLYEANKHLCRPDVLLDPVVSVADAGTADVYDLTVPGPEHFICENIVVHNCKHILAAREYIYGLLTTFQGTGPDTADKLRQMVKYAQKRWADFPAQMKAAKERERRMAAAKAARKVGAPVPGVVEPVAPEPDVVEPQPPETLLPAPLPEPEAPTPPTSIAVPPGQRGRGFQAPPQNQLAIPPGQRRRQFPGGRQNLESASVGILNGQPFKTMTELNEAIKLVEQMYDEEEETFSASDEKALVPVDDTMPAPSDASLGADTEGAAALDVLGEIRDLLGQLVSLETQETMGDEEGAGDEMPPIEDRGEEDEEFGADFPPPPDGEDLDGDMDDEDDEDERDHVPEPA